MPQDTFVSIAVVPSTPVDSREEEKQSVKDSNMNRSNNVAQELSPVEQMFRGRSVFVTGASGFVGRVLVEKLVRCYPGIKRIYILMRTKKGQSPTERLYSHLLSAPIFDAIKAQPEGQQMLNEKLVVVAGDIALPQLGISEEDLEAMLADPSLSIVIHTAATVKFDEPLKRAVQLNIKPIRELVNLCRRLPNLISLCHVSTTYVNAHMKDGHDIEERIYPIDVTPAQVIELSESLDEKTMQKYKTELLGERPNTYTFTKALGEHLLMEEAKDLPVTIVRPSIIMAAWKEPMPGWIDSINGPNGVIVAWSAGVIRTLFVKSRCMAELIPVDVVANSIIAAGYYTAKRSGKLDVRLHKQDLEEEDDQTHRQTIPIVHCTCGDDNPLTWDQVNNFLPIFKKFPSIQQFRYPVTRPMKDNQYLDWFVRLFVHYLPALILDLICTLVGKKRRMMRLYKNVHKALDTTAHFRAFNYTFKSPNLHLIEDALEDERDRQTLYLNIRDLDWYEYWHLYMLGARRWIMKESDESLEKAKRQLNGAYYKELAIRLLLVLIFSYLILNTFTNTSQVTQTWSQTTDVQTISSERVMNASSRSKMNLITSLH